MRRARARFSCIYIFIDVGAYTYREKQKRVPAAGQLLLQQTNKKKKLSNATNRRRSRIAHVRRVFPVRVQRLRGENRWMSLRIQNIRHYYYRYSVGIMLYILL